MKRWLAAVAVALGAAVGSAHAESSGAASTALDQNRVLYPRTSAAAPAGSASAAPNGTMTIVLVCVLGAAGGWMLWNKIRSRGPMGMGGRQLTIAETKSLGNRQFLVVASYQDRKFLLGVCPGRIDLLSTLDNAGAAPASPPTFTL